MLKPFKNTSFSCLPDGRQDGEDDGERGDKQTDRRENQNKGKATKGTFHAVVPHPVQMTRKVLPKKSCQWKTRDT